MHPVRSCTSSKMPLRLYFHVFPILECKVFDKMPLEFVCEKLVIFCAEQGYDMIDEMAP